MTRRRGVNAETADIGIGERVIMTPFPSFPAESHLRLGGLLVDALACFRLSRLLTTDRITQPLRDRLWRRFPPESTKIGYISTCDWCTSIWVAGGILIARRVTPRAWALAADGLAMSAATGLLSTYADS